MRHGYVCCLHHPAIELIGPYYIKVMTSISHKHKFVFLSNPKCASTSIHKMLRPHSEICGQKHLHADLFGKHDAASKVKATMEKMGFKWEDYFIFTTVRYPVTRVLSSYAYERKDTKQFPDSLLDLDTYIRENKYHHFYDFHKFGCDSDGKRLVDQVIRMEDLSSTLLRLFKKLHLPAPPTVLHDKISDSQKYRNLLNNELIEIIQDRHQSDMIFYKNFL